MTLALSPEAVQQIRAIVDEALRGALAVIDGRFDAVDRRFDAVARRLEDGLAENRRQFGVIAESLQTKLELVIEGQVGLGQKLDRETGALRDGIETLDRRVLGLSARLSARRRDS